MHTSLLKTAVVLLTLVVFTSCFMLESSKDSNSQDIPWTFNNCSAFNLYLTKQVYLSSVPVMYFLRTTIIMEAIVNQDKLTLDEALMDISWDLVNWASVGIPINKSYKKGDLIRWESPLLDTPQGHEGLWTFNIQMMGPSKVGCFSINIDCQKDCKK